jgi:hypothetical protein
MWWIRAQLKRNRRVRPTKLAKKLETSAYCSGPAAMATSHQASRRKPTAFAAPEHRPVNLEMRGERPIRP